MDALKYLLKYLLQVGFPIIAHHTGVPNGALLNLTVHTGQIFADTKS